MHLLAIRTNNAEIIHSPSTPDRSGVLNNIKSMFLSTQLFTFIWFNQDNSGGIKISIQNVNLLKLYCVKEIHQVCCNRFGLRSLINKAKELKCVKELTSLAESDATEDSIKSLSTKAFKL